MAPLSGRADGGQEPQQHHGISDRSPATIAGLLIPHIVCTIFILARLWSRLRLLRKWFFDDGLIVVAWAFSTAVCVVYTLAAETPNIRQAVGMTAEINNSNNNNNSSSSNSSPSESESEGRAAALNAVQSYLLETYLGLIFYQLCLCLTKLSILSFYLRMFSSRPLERRLAWGTVVFVLAFGVPLLFISIFQCHPASGEFFGSSGLSPSSPSSGTAVRCFSFTPLLIASASLHTATDAWLIVLVVPCIWRLDLPVRQKAALGVVLSLGVFVVAASLTRLQLSLHANYRPSGSGVQVTDTLTFFVMTILECDIALICACAPTLRPLLAKLWPRSGMGEPLRPIPRQRPKRRSRLVMGLGMRRADDDDNSVNLTTVVSYHGYPWVTPAGAPRRNKSSGSVSPNANGNAPPPSRHMQMQLPVPPVPALSMAHRTPTTMSLKSLMSVLPRSRGMTTTDRGEDRTGLLPRDDDATTLDYQQRRRSSVGLEGFFELCTGGAGSSSRHEEEGAKGGWKRRSRAGSKGTATASELRRSSGAGAWSHSQESFVLGMNDPASPHRLSPVSGFSGATFTAARPTRDVDDDNQDNDDGDEGIGGPLRREEEEAEAVDRGLEMRMSKKRVEEESDKANNMTNGREHQHMPSAST